MKVFLSHSSKDKDLVRKVNEKLGNDLSWFDAMEIDNGDRIPDKVSEGLEKCTHFVLFWSANSAKASWVKAELNAAFVKMMSDKCKFMIFRLDQTQLPILLQPYKYDDYDLKQEDIDTVGNQICDIILKEESKTFSKNTFVNRTEELGDIEDCVRDEENKIIILTGILGIGKSSLALRANEWLFGREHSTVVIDFNRIPGIAELVFEMYRKMNEDIPDRNDTREIQLENIEYALEKISYSKSSLILKDVKKWLNEDGKPNDVLEFIFNQIINSNMFEGLSVIVTSSRYIHIDINQSQHVKTIKVKALQDNHIEIIIKNNLLKSFMDYNKEKNREFAKHLCGYPLGARLAANNISVHGYDFYLSQNFKIKELKIGLAKQLISYAQVSDECVQLLKYMALVQSRLKNEEYVLTGLMKNYESVGKYTEEAFFAGLVNIDEDGCYRLEHIVEDYYYDLAFNDKGVRKKLCIAENYIEKNFERVDVANKYRLLMVLIHIMTLNGHISRAMELRKELTETMIASMWDLYNHREYDEAYDVASGILDAYPENVDAKYMQALCCIRNEKYSEAKKIIKSLQNEDLENYRYYYALGRIEKYSEHYEKAIGLFLEALEKKRRHCSSLREIAECYYYLNDLKQAHKYIDRAKEIDEDNVWTVLLECRILSKEGNNELALESIGKESLLIDDPSQILFRKGRIYDEMNDSREAIKCYESALKYNSKQYDARLCLLHHNLSNDDVDCIDEINKLEKILKGKRHYILMNIKARYIGYFGHEEENALEILNEVEDKYIDRQWYAVKLQLLEKIVKKHKAAGRPVMAEKYEKEILLLKAEMLEKYNWSEITEQFFLPDA